MLVLGCSTGYGLASRIAAAFEYGAATIGVSFEKEGSEKKGGTPGWYNNMAFDRAAHAAGLKAVTLNMDAFSDACRTAVIEEAKKMGVTFDLVVYSLASPVRTDPDTGVLYKSVLKPIGKPFSGQTVDMMTGKISVMTAEPASDEEAANTVKVMGGEDWERWINQLSAAGVLSKGCMTVAYSYIGPELSHAIYRDGTIGGAKKHLEKTARALDAKLSQELGGHAYVSVNKGLVTRSSAVIPIIPLYLSVLFKVMKGLGIHEGCIEQMYRLISEKLFNGGEVPVDSDNRIRLDDWELREDVQKEVLDEWNKLTKDNVKEIADLALFRKDYMNMHGFDEEGIDYSQDVKI